MQLLPNEFAFFMMSSLVLWLIMLTEIEIIVELGVEQFANAKKCARERVTAVTVENYFERNIPTDT